MYNLRSKSSNIFSRTQEDDYMYYTNNEDTTISSQMNPNGFGPKYIHTSSNSSGNQDLRCHSAISSSSYASMQVNNNNNNNNTNGCMDLVEGGGEQWKFKKGKSTNGIVISKSWSFMNDPEMKRKKRVASYKAYKVEGKVKGSLKNTFRWIKDKCSKIIYGYNR